MMARLRSAAYWVRFVETGVRLSCSKSQLLRREQSIYHHPALI
jgi:hypothetical protein